MALLWKILYGHRLAPGRLNWPLWFASLPPNCLVFKLDEQLLSKTPKRERNLEIWRMYVCVLNSLDLLFCAAQCKNNVSITSSRMEYGGREADFEVCSIKEFGKNVNFVFNQYLEKYCKTLTYGISWTKIVIIFPFFSLTVWFGWWFLPSDGREGRHNQLHPIFSQNIAFMNSLSAFKIT